MLAVNQASAGKSIGHLPQNRGGVLLAPLVLIGNRSYKILCWFRNEWRWNGTLRELNRLNDHYLDDIGIRRCYLELRDEDLVKRLRDGG